MFDRFRGGDDPPEVAREQLVDRLESQGRVTDEATLDALRSVPRHKFVPQSRQSEAYDDRPLPIGDDQTISAPHMVGIMTELLGAAQGDRVLEVGTGCGYHAAVTAEVVGEENVYSVEYSRQLAEKTRERLNRLGYDIAVRIGDGAEGWPEHAPYDAAYLTCAAESLPEPLPKQVRPGGTILAPIGTRRQTLNRYEKRADGSLDRTSHGGVRFVQMRG